MDEIWIAAPTKLAECCRKLTNWIVSHVVALIAGPLLSGHRSNRSFATSAAPTVLDMVVMAAIATTTGAVTTPIVTATAMTTGGDEFHSLGTHPHLTSAGNLLVYPSKGLGSKARAFIFC